MAITWVGRDIYCAAADVASLTTNVPANTKAYVDNDDVYRFNGTSWVLFSANDKTETLTNKTISGTTNTLSSIPVNSISTFAVSAPATNQIMQYNGTNWVNATSSATGVPTRSELYTVYKDGTTYKARNNITNAIDFSSSTPDLGAILNSCIDAMTDGGTVFIAAGNYTGFATKVTINNTFIGIMGERGTKITAPATYADDLIAVEAADCFIGNIYFDGTAMANGSGTFINTGNGAVQSDRTTVSDCFIKNSPTHGVYAGSKCNGLKLSHCDIQSFQSPTGNALYINSSADHCILGNGIGGYANGTSGAGINLNTSSEVVIVGNEIYTNRIGIQVFNAESTIISSNLIQASRQHGIYVLGSGTTIGNNLIITNNRIHNSSTATTNGYDGMAFSFSGTSSLDRCVITGNVSTDDSPPGSKKVRYGININTASLINATIENNVVSGNVTGGINEGTLSATCYVGVNPGHLRAANPDTSSGVVATVETEVNQIKAVLRSMGIIAP